MDALPVTEQTEIDFRSEVEGKMHACGHDCHTAMLLGAARLLKGREKQLQGTVKLLFQPAEEGGAGAARMIKEGALRDPDADRAFALHVWSDVPTGSIFGFPGPMLAAAGELKIKVTGVGGHAAMPHRTVDPIVCAAKLVVELQTLVSRELDPLEAGVVSITALNGGRATNVIPPEVKMLGTIRSLSSEGLERLQSRITEVTDLVTRAGRCTGQVKYPGNTYPPTVNDEHCIDLISEIATDLLGSDSVRGGEPVMGGEDFAYVLEQVPGCIVGLGIRNEAVGATYNVHHPCFMVDEDALPIGAALHTAFALRSLDEL
jgi:IAA-amino acid hydrolase